MSVLKFDASFFCVLSLFLIFCSICGKLLIKLSLELWPSNDNVFGVPMS